MKIFIVLVVVSIAVSTELLAEDNPKGRAFTSLLPLSVYCYREMNQMVPQTVGYTPNRKALQIPRCYAWYVRPLKMDMPHDFDVISNEIRRRKISGLELGGNDVTSVIGRVTSELDLEYLFLANTRITRKFAASLMKLKRLKKLTLNECNLEDDGVVELISKIPSLQVLDLVGTGGLTVAGFQYIGEMDSLRGLLISTGNVHIDGICFKQLNPKLEYLGILSKITNYDTGALGHLKNLKHLYFGCVGITNLNFVKSLSKLETLSVCSTDIDDDSLAVLKNCSELKWLNIISCNNLTDAGLRHIGDIKSLEWLGMGSPHFTDNGLRHVKKLAKLKDLDIRGVRKVSNEGLEYICQIKQLEKLHLRFELPTDDLSSLENLSKLKDIFFFDAKALSDISLQSFTALKNLEQVRLRSCRNITDKGLKYLTRLKKLNTILLSDFPKISAKGLKYLAEIDKLKSLDIRKCPKLSNSDISCLSHLKDLSKLNGPFYIDGKDLQSLCGFKSLDYLTVPSDNISPLLLEKLRRKLPYCRVNHRLSYAAEHWRDKIKTEK